MEMADRARINGGNLEGNRLRTKGFAAVCPSRLEPGVIGPVIGMMGE